MRIVLIRHLPTAWNQAAKLQGRRDEPILDVDADLADGIRRRRSQMDGFAPFSLVLASTLRRTHQTACAYGEQAFVVEPLLDELDYGAFEGRNPALLARTLGIAWREDPASLVLGESLKNLEQRIRSFLATYADRPSVLAFGHGGWSRAFVSILRWNDLREMNQFTLPNNAMIVGTWPNGTVSIHDQ